MQDKGIVKGIFRGNNDDICLFLRAMSQVPCLHEHLANAARVKDPTALQRCKLDTPLLAAGSLICYF